VIGRTIDNISKQTYQDVEIIVVDDGSTDDTQARLSSFGERIRTVYQKNGGAASARNRGIREARGEIIAFQDSDDEWHPTKLERQVRLLELLGPKVPCCVCNARFRFASSSQPDQYTFEIANLSSPYEEGLWTNPTEILATRCLFFNQAVAVRRDALERVGGFNVSLRYLEDWDLALKLSVLGPWAFIRDPLAYWNAGSENSLTSSAERDTPLLHECACRLLTDAIAGVSGTNPRMKKLLGQTLLRHRRSLQALRIKQGKLPARLLADVMVRTGHYRTAIQRRIGRFPNMLTEAVVWLEGCRPKHRDESLGHEHGGLVNR